MRAYDHDRIQFNATGEIGQLVAFRRFPPSDWHVVLSPSSTIQDVGRRVQRGHMGGEAQAGRAIGVLSARKLSVLCSSCDLIGAAASSSFARAARLGRPAVGGAAFLEALKLNYIARANGESAATIIRSVINILVRSKESCARDMAPNSDQHHA
jgi:hypothetical protein